MASLVYVVHRNPCLPAAQGPDDVLGELTKAFDKQIRKAWNAPGDGAFSINTNDDEYAWCQQGNYVRVYRDSVGGDLLFGFFIETGSVELVSPEEGGGEIATLAGRGPLSILERASLYQLSYLPNGDDLGALPQDDPDGMWHWTDRPPGAILVRQLEEAIIRASLSPHGISSIEPVTWDFTRHQDSNGNAWETSAGDLFKLAVGMNLFSDVLPALQAPGLIVDMSPNFELKGWDTDQGADVSADVAFLKGVNIRDSASLQLDAITAASTVLVQGDLDAGLFTYAVRDDTDIGIDVESQLGRIERFVEFHFTPTSTKLTRVGDTALRRASHQLLGPTTIGVVERAGEVPFVDYNPGDIVGTDLGDRRIGAIGLFETDGGEYDPVIEFESGAPLAQVITYLMAG